MNFRNWLVTEYKSGSRRINGNEATMQETVGKRHEFNFEKTDDGVMKLLETYIGVYGDPATNGKGHKVTRTKWKDGSIRDVVLIPTTAEDEWKCSWVQKRGCLSCARARSLSTCHSHLVGAAPPPEPPNVNVGARGCTWDTEAVVYCAARLQSAQLLSSLTSGWRGEGRLVTPASSRTVVIFADAGSSPLRSPENNIAQTLPALRTEPNACSCGSMNYGCRLVRSREVR